MDILSPPRYGFSLSPRGDGNHAAELAAQVADDFLYPRKGTETKALEMLRVPANDFLYPRKGTETYIVVFSRPNACDFLYPRKGTEASSPQQFIMVVGFSLSPQGDGNGSR